jgi:transcriptional regulator with XRE-family HTH domain
MYLTRRFPRSILSVLGFRLSLINSKVRALQSVALQLKRTMRVNPSVTIAFGQTVRSKRKLRKLSQEQLAALAGVHRTYLADVERGSRNLSINNVWKIAKALDLTVSELCHNVDNHSSKVSHADIAIKSRFVEGMNLPHSETADLARRPATDFELDVALHRKGYVTMTTVGLIDELSLPLILTSSAKAAKKFGCSRFFLDHRGSKVRLNTGDLYRLPADLKRHGISGHRVALLLNELGENERLLQTICSDQPLSIKAFSDAAQAVTWLLERSDT